jgi:outer membrane protein assembly factor BamB
MATCDRSDESGCRVGRRRFTAFLAATTGLLSVAVQPASAFQQRREPVRFQRGEPPRAPEVESYRLTPQSDRDAERWLRRAEEAAERGDWKLASDTLMRVVNQYGDRTISPNEGQQFYSAAWYAQEQLAAWPEEGLQTYRLLFDPEVRNQFETARRENDVDALRDLVRRYPHTTTGPEALDLLATWLLDRREGGEAAEVLNRLLNLSHRSVPDWRILSRLSVAYALSGEIERATATLSSMKGLPAAGAMELPPDWNSRVASVESFIVQRSANFSGGGPVGSQANWPTPSGAPEWAGQMPALKPAVTPESFWQDTLPGAERLDARLTTTLIESTGRSPVWRCVSDGKSLFVTCPDGLIARDLATFDFLWQVVPRAGVRDPGINRFRSATGTLGADNTDNLDELATRSLYHEYRGTVTTAFGRVFVIEQPGTADETFPATDGTVPPNVGAALPQPNSLRAFEADTGRALWTKGRGGPVEDDLRAAHFFSPPVACGADLIAPYQLRDDLFLAVLAPDGAVRRTLHLGAGKAGLYPMNGVLQPTVHDGRIFIPTGAGTLIALSAHDYSLRWLASYDRSKVLNIGHGDQRQPWGFRRLSIAQTDEWLASPPLTVGALVILATHDCDRLLAFHRESGMLSWSVPRGQHRYIVGAREDQIYLAGQFIQALRVADGERVWTFDAAPLTGRPALCGDQILVPTSEGLLRVDAETGKSGGDLLPSRLPLGNLLALDGALYSVSVDGVAKFPDVDQSRALAHAALENDPNDARAILRLAWLATIEGQWDEALDALDRAEALLAGAQSATLDRIAHQRVRVLLRAAAEADVDVRLELVTKAAAAAKRPDDAVQAGLALCELLHDQGRSEDAFDRGIELLRERADVPLELEPHLLARAAVLLRERLGAVWRGADAVARKRLVNRIRATAEKAVADGHWSAVRHFSGSLDFESSHDDGGLSDLLTTLDRELAAFRREAGDPDGAAYFLERVARRGPDDPAGLDALARLAVQYAQPGGEVPSLPDEAARIIAEMEARHSGRSLPSRDDCGQLKLSSCRVEDLCAALRRALPKRVFAPPDQLPGVLQDRPQLEFDHGYAVPASFQQRDVASFLDERRVGDLFPGVVPIRHVRQIIGVNPRPGSGERLLWVADLDEAIENAGLFMATSSGQHNLDAACWGTIAVLSAGSQFGAISLQSGRWMWPPMAIGEAMIDDLPRPSVIVIDGQVILARDAHTLLAIPATSNARPDWERQFVGRRIATLADANGQLVVVDDGAEQLTVIDPRSGRVRRQYDLLVPQLNAGDGPSLKNALKNIVDAAGGQMKDAGPLDGGGLSDAHVAIAGGVVCRSGHDRLVGRDVATGQRLWDLPLGGFIRGLLRLDDRHVGVSYRSRHFAVVDVSIGKVVRDITTDDWALPPHDATVDWIPDAGGRPRGRLLLFAQTKADPSQYELATFSLDQREPGVVHELGAMATISRRMMRASPYYVAALSYDLNEQQRRRQQFAGGPGPRLEAATLVILDKITLRRLIDTPLTFDLGRLQDDQLFTGLIHDVQVLDDSIVVTGPDGYHVLKARDGENEHESH